MKRRSFLKIFTATCIACAAAGRETFQPELESIALPEGVMSRLEEVITIGFYTNLGNSLRKSQHASYLVRF